ncbi:hypothetical protein V1478_004519 [Vespula squamosa]|uniref:Secreted protein n=1 Tax=Vespula squamosa TaxID=30214 RepID=A0ABD2BGE2_VESSQ
MVPSCLAGEAVCVGSTSYGSLVRRHIDRRFHPSYSSITRRFLAEKAAAAAAAAAAVATGTTDATTLAAVPTAC